jgi:hypothetical protein
MVELPPELHDIDREALIDQLFAKWDAMFYALCESQRPPQPKDPLQAHTEPRSGSLGV